MTISRLRAGLVVTFAAVSLMAGAQAAQACTEPALGDLPARGQEKKLVRFELTGLTPGSEYLVKVNGRERKSGIAAGDKVSRRFRMPNMGDSNRRVNVEVVIAHDGCENSPWKLEEKMTYRPEPVPEAPKAQPEPTPTPTPDPTPTPSPSPPPPAPDPPSPPSIDSTPSPQPAVPTPTPTPKSTVPSPAAPALTEPPRDGKAWITPQDPYQRAENPAFTLPKGAIARTEQPSEIANSTAALIGLGGIFLLLAGVGAIGWTRFRRYDEERLQEVENPEGKLPLHLDPKAKDVGDEAPTEPQPVRLTAPLPTSDPTAPVVAGAAAAAPGEKRKRFRLRKPKAPEVGTATAAAAGAGAAAAAASDGERGGRGRGVLADLTPEERASMTPEELNRLKIKRRVERRKSGPGKKRKAELPTFDPTAPGAEAAAAAAAGGAKAEQENEDEPAQKKSLWRRRRKDAPAPAPADPPAPEPAQRANGKPPAADIPPVPAPQPNGAGHVNGVPPAAATPSVPPSEPAKPAEEPARPARPEPTAGHSYRAEVETELQRILNAAGLNAEVDGILADAKKEAQKQGVPIDSDLMLKALCDETNGAAKLSDSARGELESRFKRIVAEERGGPGSPG